MSPAGPLGARELRDLFARHDVRPLKEFGQNFVIDPNTITKIVDAASVGPTDRVLEIGAGAGSLTRGLAGAAEKVVAVELDRRMVPVLEESLVGLDNVEILEGDALEIDLSDIDTTKLVANLPYNIAVPMVLRVLEEAPQIVDLTVMTQREVGERLAATPGSKAYGHVSVMVRYFANARVDYRVSRNAFYPVPGVDSVVVRVTRLPKTPAGSHERLFEVVRGAFSQRRKTLRNSLATVAGSTDRAAAACTAAGIDPGARAETVDLEGFVRITRELA